MQCHPHPDFLCRRYRLAGIYIIHKLRDKVREGISYRVRHQHVPFTFSIILVCQHKTELLEFIESFAYLAYHVCIGTDRDKLLKQLMFRLAKRIADGSKADIRTVFLIFDGNHISNFRKQNLPQYTCLHYAFPC